MTDEPGQPPAIRVSDAEREQVADRLRDAAAEGRLTVEELTERLDSVYDARTNTDLTVLTEDLPPASASASAAGPIAGGKPPRKWALAFMGGSDRRGRWRVGRTFNALALMGGGDLDLRDATLVDGELTLTVVAIMGGFDVLVPAGADVEVSGFAFMGGRDVKLSGEPPPPGAPKIHIRAFALMGGVDVRDQTRSERRAARRHGHGLHPPAPPEPPRLPEPPAPPRPPEPPRSPE